MKNTRETLHESEQRELDRYSGLSTAGIVLLGIGVLCLCLMLIYAMG